MRRKKLKKRRASGNNAQDLTGACPHMGNRTDVNKLRVGVSKQEVDAAAYDDILRQEIAATKTGRSRLNLRRARGVVSWSSGHSKP
ncbi:hypothetical protein PHYPSEUDO_006026 [Phytophthora pseudosyringae]|uniref:Uncharacterized protein n=1 Tax=Phytophthora pseudosyringae TaxID=221518 RepID=A0A8T1VMM3_9STRA|nr:hypothetical protein PHYPSEUDO_006026 [Phytophthora pseudosyringae]